MNAQTQKGRSKKAGLEKFKATLSAIWWGFVISPILTKWSLARFMKIDFVFLVHPRVTEDLFLQFPFLKIFGEKLAKWILLRLWSVVGSEITTGNHVRGRIVFCPWTVEMMLADEEGALEAIRRAAKTSHNLGAKYVGTGALTASMSGLGKHLIDVVEVVTTGHAATSVLGVRILIESLIRIGKDPADCTVAVVGCGSIGYAVAWQLGGAIAWQLAKKKVGNLILIDRKTKEERLKALALRLREVYGITVEIAFVEEGGYKRLQEADGVFTATSTPRSWLMAEWLKAGAVVVDDSQPLSMSSSEAEKHNGIVLQVLASMPGTDCHFWFSKGVGRHWQYTCLAEVVALAQHGNGTKGVIGPVTLEKADDIAYLLEEAGFDNLVFVSFGREVTEEQWGRVRDLCSIPVSIKLSVPCVGVPI